jgi:hypothetical protein
MKKTLTLIVLLLLQPLSGFAITVSDYLIDANIGDYSRSYPGSCPEGSGILAGADHFMEDHTDYACDVRYYKKVTRLGIEVQVTKHSGSDSDKWLAHEVERGFRDTDKLESSPDEDSKIREVNGHKVFFYGGGVVGYRWLSNNIVVNIQYNNLGGPKPEPLEVVKAYLAKLPSSIVMSDIEFKTRAHNETWIKDEMDRRLWLCDKWFMQLQLKKFEEKLVYQESVKSMNIFLDYREKYYGIKAADDKNLLAGYLSTNNGTGIKAKLTESKNWWSVHKSDAISL